MTIMKNKKNIAVSAILAMTASLALVGCNGTPATPEKEIKSVVLSYTPGSAYVVGETVREPNNELVVTYTDKTKEYIPTTDPDVTVTGDTSTKGKHTGKLSYKGYDFEFDYTVYETLDDTVEVTGGTIQGFKTLEGDVEMYQGIPYAAPPVGDLRWHAPKDVVPWDGVLDCYHFGASPIQIMHNVDPYYIDPWSGVSEDCLTLNVWTNGKEVEQGSTGKPVLVYIYGGAYTAGGGSVPIYSGLNMARKDVVFVNLNYRLGMFGFLATDELKAENDGCGNFAILDQIKALEWVKENIAAFGGDPDNVTIMGQSAGAMSIESLLATPLADGLFVNAAIISSGMSFTKPLTTTAEAIAKADIKNYSLAELRKMTPEELESNISSGVGVSYDNYVIKSPSTKEAYVNNDATNTKNVNILIGSVTGDTVMFGDMRNLPTASQVDCMIAQRNMLINAHILGNGTGKNWQYYYSYIQGGTTLAGHTDDVTFWLGNQCDKYKWNDQDTLMADMLSDYLVNFCRTGDPNGEGLTTWEESKGDYAYMHIDTTCTFERLSSTAISEFETVYSELSDYFPAK